MRGAWAGELGQTQFMPSSWVKYAVDFDGNGKRDLLRSAPDVLASTANDLANYGWQRGKGWEAGEPNFAVLQQWNKSEVYAKTVAHFATQLAHAAVRISASAWNWGPFARIAAAIARGVSESAPPGVTET